MWSELAWWQVDRPTGGDVIDAEHGQCFNHVVCRLGQEHPMWIWGVRCLEQWAYLGQQCECAFADRSRYFQRVDHSAGSHPDEPAGVAW